MVVGVVLCRQSILWPQWADTPLTILYNSVSMLGQHRRCWPGMNTALWQSVSYSPRCFTPYNAPPLSYTAHQPISFWLDLWNNHYAESRRQAAGRLSMARVESRGIRTHTHRTVIPTCHHMPDKGVANDYVEYSIQSLIQRELELRVNSDFFI